MMPDRRSFLTALGAGCTLLRSARAQSPIGGTSQLFWTVETTSGKVQGIANTGIKEFKGIPYGAPTGGKNRYMPPKKPAAWTAFASVSATVQSPLKRSPICAAITPC